MKFQILYVINKNIKVGQTIFKHTRFKNLIFYTSLLKFLLRIHSTKRVDQEKGRHKIQKTGYLTQDRGKKNPQDDGERRSQKDTYAPVRDTSQDQSDATQDIGMLSAIIIKIFDVIVYSNSEQKVQ